MQKYLLTAWVLFAAIPCHPIFAAENLHREMERWGWMAVQEGGRYKPLDTLAWETARRLGNRSTVSDPTSGERLNATAFYLAVLFDWQGWEAPPSSPMLSAMPGQDLYYRSHQPDKWDHAPLLLVEHLPLRSALGMKPNVKHISPWELGRAKIAVSATNDEQPFLRWAENLPQQSRTLNRYEQAAVELAHTFRAYQDLRVGRQLAIVPMPSASNNRWLTVAELRGMSLDATNDPSGVLRSTRQALENARAAYRANAGNQFRTHSLTLLSALTSLRQNNEPAQSAINWEVVYNRAVPFRFAWLFMLAAFVGVLLQSGTGWRSIGICTWSLYGCSLAAMLVGFALRVVITGRAPVTNMYESVVYMGLGVALLGLVLQAFYRSRLVMGAAAAVATFALILADNCPAALNASLQPLQPVLRNNFWLVTHVMTITLSYAAFALALGIGNVTLAHYLLGSENEEAISRLTHFTYRTLQVGVLLLAAGTLLGGVWADYAWGRFWGWDPKEVWALISLLGYLAVLHARYVAWVRDLGLAALSVLCFALVVMAWYGVNFVLGTGLHSYGFGGGGSGFVLTAVALQCLYVAAAAITHRLRSEQMGSSEVLLPVPTATIERRNAA